jgi:hypothetical protein
MIYLDPRWRIFVPAYTYGLLLFIALQPAAELLASPQPKDVLLGLGSNDFKCTFASFAPYFKNGGTCTGCACCRNDTEKKSCLDFGNLGFKFFGQARTEPSGIRTDYFQSAKKQMERAAVFVGYSNPSIISNFDNSDWEKYGFMLHSTEFGKADALNRYLWYISCQLFAHGPEIAHDYTSPGDFNTMKGMNVFARWTKKNLLGSQLRPFGNHLRLACGMSSLIVVSPDIFSPVLFNLEHQNWPVAESFLLGMQPAGVPLCLTRSAAEEAQQTPLADSTFLPHPNSAPLAGGFAFAAYPTESTRSLSLASSLTRVLESPGASKIDYSAPELDPSTRVPILNLMPSEPPEWLYGLMGESVDTYGYSQISMEQLPVDIQNRLRMAFGGPGDFLLRHQRKSGGYLISFKSHQTAPADACNHLLGLGELAYELVSSGEPSSVLYLDDPKRTQLAVDRVAQDRIDSNKKYQAVSTVSAFTESRQLLVAYQPETTNELRFIPVFGLASGETLRCSPKFGGQSGDNSSSIAVLLPKIVSLGTGAIRSRGDALFLAAQELEKIRPSGVHYSLDRASPRWAYKQQPFHCNPGTIYAYYFFDYTPSSTESSYPRITIEVPAHLEAEAHQLQCDGPDLE